MTRQVRLSISSSYRPRALHPSRRHYTTSEERTSKKDYNNIIYIDKNIERVLITYPVFECSTYYCIIGRQNTVPQTSLVIFLLLWHHLRVETAKLGCFITYNNMGSKTLSTECTFASLTRQRKRLSRIC
jgi:hypothetical protein